MNLTQQISLLNQKLDIEREKTALEHDRGEFHKEQAVAKDKIIDQYAAMNDKLLKEKQKSSLWKTLAIAEILLFIGVVVGALL